jgi:hypothetical protein
MTFIPTIESDDALARRAFAGIMGRMPCAALEWQTPAQHALAVCRLPMVAMARQAKVRPILESLFKQAKLDAGFV